MSDPTNRSPDESTDIHHCDMVHPDDHATCEHTGHDDAPSRSDLDEREANRSSTRKAPGPGGQGGQRGQRNQREQNQPSHALPVAESDAESASEEHDTELGAASEEGESEAGSASREGDSEAAPETRLES